MGLCDVTVFNPNFKLRQTQVQIQSNDFSAYNFICVLKTHCSECKFALNLDKFEFKTVTKSHELVCGPVSTCRLVFDLTFEQKNHLFAVHYFLFHISSIMTSESTLPRRLPRAKQEGRWIVLGETDHAELQAMKCLGMFKWKRRTSLAFSIPEFPCCKVYTIFLVNDCYFGLDQQCLLQLEFTSRNHES